MKTQRNRSPVEKHQGSAPPGFASLTTFMLRKAVPFDDPSSPMAIDSHRDVEISSMPTSIDSDNSDIKRRLKVEQRPWIVYDQFQDEGEADSKQPDMSLSSKGCLPKGVIRGCPECSDCQKVSARWDPEGACTYVLEEAPVFHPNEEEFKDTFNYIGRIRQQVEPYGFCRIVPPPSWKLPCFLEEIDIWQSHKFPTQTQRVNELENHATRETKKRRLAYEFGDGCDSNFITAECHGPENCQSESGPQFNLITFKRYADYFRQCYFSRDAEVYQKEWEPSEQNIEGEYWRIVVKPTEEVEVLHGTQLDSRSFGSGFPESSNPEQESAFEKSFNSGWNLNHISRLPGSLLSFEKSDHSVILTPRLHVGMCFSSLPWTVEEHQLYKLCYLHLGAPRIWYGTARCDPYKVEVAIKKHLPDSLEEHPEMHHKLGRQVSPAKSKSEDIPVYRCIQRPQEFVLFLPGACHSGFDCGFNCSVSAAFAPLDWLPRGLNSTELYRERRRKTSISYDKVLLKAANEAVKRRWECLVKGKKTPNITIWIDASGKNGILAKALRTRIRLESSSREYLSSASQSRKMDNFFDGGDEKRECSTCYYDLYLSAANCPCTPNKFSCLKHAKDLCSCPWGDKVFLFRYLISELDMLLEAVEGKLAAIRSWVKEDLGLALCWDKPNEAQYGHAMDPTSSGKDMASASKSVSEAQASPPGEISSGNPKGKELASEMGSIWSSSLDDTSSLPSLESDIEAYITLLRSSKMRNLGESFSNRSTQQNVSGSSVGVPSEKDDASSSKLASEEKTPLQRNVYPAAPKGEELDTSLSSSSESDVEAYISRLQTRKKRNS